RVNARPDKDICAYAPIEKSCYLQSFVVDINCDVTAGHKYVHSSSPSGIAPGGCFPRARPQPPRENHSAESSDTCCSRRSHHPPLTRTMKGLYADFCTRTTIANGSKCNTSGGNTRRLLGEERPRRDPAVRQREEGHQPPPARVVYFRSSKRHQQSLILFRSLRILC